MEAQLWVNETSLALFGKGKKLEVRVKNDTTKKIVAGTTLVFNNVIRTSVIKVRSYASLETMLMKEELKFIAPGSTRKEFLETAEKQYPPRTRKEGILVFELMPTAIITR